jgi:amino acid permease
MLHSSQRQSGARATTLPHPHSHQPPSELACSERRHRPAGNNKNHCFKDATIFILFSQPVALTIHQNWEALLGPFKKISPFNSIHQSLTALGSAMEKALLDNDGLSTDDDGSKGKAGATLTLFAAFVGGGIMGLPYAFQNISIIPSIFLAALCALLTALSLYYLAVVAEHLPAKSFAESAGVIGPRSVFFMDMFSTVVLCGVIISLQILIKDNCKKMVEGFGTHGGEAELASGVVLLAIVCSCVMLPLALLRRVEFLKYSSFGSICSILYVVILVIAKGAAQRGATTGAKLTNYVAWNKLSLDKFVSFAPVVIFAFGCQVQMTPIYWSLPARSRSVAEFVPVFSTAVFGYFILVVCVGVFGVLAFPSHKFDCGDVLLNFDPRSTSAIIGRLALTVSLSLMSPLLVFPARESMKNALFPGEYWQWQDESGEKQPALARVVHVLITCTILGCSFAVAASVEKVVGTTSEQ